MERKFVLIRGKNADDNQKAEAVVQLLQDGRLGTVRFQERGNNLKPILRVEGESPVLAEGKEEVEQHVHQLLSATSTSALPTELALV